MYSAHWIVLLFTKCCGCCCCSVAATRYNGLCRDATCRGDRLTCKGNRCCYKQGPDGTPTLWFEFPHHKNEKYWGGQAIIYEVPQQLVEVLQPHLTWGHQLLAGEDTDGDEVQCPYVFLNRQGKQLQTSEVSPLFKKVLDVDFGPQMFRSIFVEERRSQNRAAGPEDEHAAFLMGHNVSRWTPSYDKARKAKQASHALTGMQTWRQQMLEQHQQKTAAAAAPTPLPAAAPTPAPGPSSTALPDVAGDGTPILYLFTQTPSQPNPSSTDALANTAVADAPIRMETAGMGATAAAAAAAAPFLPQHISGLPFLVAQPDPSLQAGPSSSSHTTNTSVPPKPPLDLGALCEGFPAWWHRKAAIVSLREDRNELVRKMHQARSLKMNDWEMKLHTNKLQVELQLQRLMAEEAEYLLQQQVQKQQQQAVTSMQQPTPTHQVLPLPQQMQDLRIEAEYNEMMRRRRQE